MLKLGKVINKISVAVSLVSFIGVLVIMLLNVVDVLSTKIFTKSVAGAYELTEVFLLCTVICAYAYGQYKRTHITMSLVVKALPRVPQFFIFGLMGVLSAATAAAVGYAAMLQAAGAIAKGKVTGVLMIPWYPFYYIEAVGMFIFALAILYDAALAFAAMGNDACRDEVTRTWS